MNPIELAKASESYCPYPFRHASQLKQNAFGPCCNFLQDNLEEGKQTLTEYWNGSFLKEIQDKMLAGEKIQGCEKCYQSEATTGSSIRTKNIDKLGHITTPKLESIEILLSNKCNLKCRMCTAERSTSWFADEKVLYPEHEEEVFQTDVDSFFGNITDVNKIEQIDVLGGEPFIDSNMDDFLEKFPNKSDIKVTISTNGTFYPSKKFISLLKEYRKILVIISIDATGELAEYIRSGLSWEQFEKVTQFWISLQQKNPNLELATHMTLNAYNLNAAADVLSWVDQKKLHPLTFGKVHSPSAIAPESLRVETKEKIKKSLFDQSQGMSLFEQTVQDCDQNVRTDYQALEATLRKALASPEQPVDETDEFAFSFNDFTQILDKVRSQNITQSNPLITI